MTSAGQTVPLAIDSRHPSINWRPRVGMTTLTSAAMGRSPIRSPSHHEIREGNHTIHFAGGWARIAPQLARQQELGLLPGVVRERVASGPIVDELVDCEGSSECRLDHRTRDPAYADDRVVRDLGGDLPRR